MPLRLAWLSHPRHKLLRSHAEQSWIIDTMIFRWYDDCIDAVYWLVVLLQIRDNQQIINFDNDDDDSLTSFDDDDDGDGLNTLTLHSNYTVSLHAAFDMLNVLQTEDTITMSIC